MTTQSSFNLLDAAAIAEPDRHYATLRKEAPVYRVPETGWFVVSRFEDIFRALRQPLIFSNRGLRVNTPYPEVQEIYEKEGFGPPADVLIHTDPPEHTRYRKLVERRFGPARVKALEPYLAATIDELIDAFIDKGTAEIVSEFAVPLPLIVIADQLGVPREHMDKFKQWSDAAVEPAGLMANKERAIECARLKVEFERYFSERIEERRSEPRDDILSDLVHSTTEQGPPLDIRELLSVVSQLLVAGNETTTNALAGGVKALAQMTAEQIDELRKEPSLFETLSEEILRLESPVQGLFRVTTQDTELGGVQIPKDSVVHLRYASANRDEAVFECPAHLNLHRKSPARHLAFGAGIHSCIGAPLARREITFALRRLVERLDNIRLLRPDVPIEYHPHFFLRGPKRLEIAFDVRGEREGGEA